MHPNPALRKLGFANDDRVVIIHADDIGMCQASVAAFADLWDFGFVSSGATMVPCPWFLGVVTFCREHPGIDMGVHLTLTSEWATYRWGPISTRDPSSGMIDEEGYFFHTSDEAQEHGNPEAVQRELQAQIERALCNGLTLTHIDTHMGSVAHPKFMSGYIQLAMEHHLPPMIFRLDEVGWQELGFNAETATFAAKMVIQLEEQGLPLLDHVRMLALDQAGTVQERIVYAKEVFGNLPAGLTHLIIHPSKDTPELRAITSDWMFRVADYEVFLNKDLRHHVKNSGIQVIGYRVIKELMPIN